MNVDELNDLISVAHARISSLQDKLDHLEHSERERMKSALEAQRQADDSLRKEYIRQELNREHTRHEIERHKWVCDYLVFYLPNYYIFSTTLLVA